MSSAATEEEAGDVAEELIGAECETAVVRRGRRVVQRNGKEGAKEAHDGNGVV